MISRRYHKITTPTVVFAQVGVTDSNTHVGRSQVLGILYAAIDLVPGDEIHDLPGGLFAVTDDAVWKIRLNLDNLPHPFSHSFPAPKPDLPGEPTTTPRIVDYAPALQITSHSTILPLADARERADILGNGLDWLDRETANGQGE